MARKAKSPDDKDDPVPELSTKTFRFDEITLNGCCDVFSPLLIRFPPRMGGGSCTARLFGTWTAMFEPDGDFEIVEADLTISSIRVPLPIPKTDDWRWVDTGRMTVFLNDVDIEKGLKRHIGPLNCGHIDYETGFTKLTWGMLIHSPELAALEIDPVPMVFSELGFYDAKTGRLDTAGPGIVTGGLFEELVALSSNGGTPPPVPVVPPSVLTVTINPNPLAAPPPRGRRATVTITETPAPPNGTPFTLTFARGGGRLNARLNAAPRVLTGGTATVGLTAVGQAGSRGTVTATTTTASGTGSFTLA